MQYNTSLPILEAVAHGNIAQMPELIRNLAQQELYFPIASSGFDTDMLTCKALVIVQDEQLVVPAFTSRERLMLWVRLRKHSATDQRMNAAILAGALGSDIELMIDPDSSHAIQLGTAWLERLAEQVPFPEPSQRAINSLKEKVERERVSGTISVAPKQDQAGSTGMFSTFSRL